MIVGSLLLILVAVALLVVGLIAGSSILLISSIVASLLAAVSLVVGARQAAAGRAAALGPEPLAIDLDNDPGPSSTTYPAGAGRAGGAPGGASAVGRDGHPDSQDRTATRAAYTNPDRLDEADSAADAESGHAESGHAEAAEVAGRVARAAGGAQLGEVTLDKDPTDEPLAQPVQPADAVRVAGMVTEVLVVDGRPRYHLTGCSHLVDRPTEALPVAEAVELGFTPCGRCRPVERLVAGTVHR